MSRGRKAIGKQPNPTSGSPPGRTCYHGSGGLGMGGRSSRGQVLSARCSLQRYMAVPPKEWLPTVFRQEL